MEMYFKLRLIMGNMTATVISVYAPQSGLTDEQKDRFYEALLQTTSVSNDSDLVIMVGDFNLLRNHFVSRLLIGMFS